MDRLIRVRDAEKRIVAGLMTGTSLDGVDAVVVRLRGTGTSMDVEVLSFVHYPYPDALRTALLRLAESEASVSSDDGPTADLARMNVRLPRLYAEAVEAAMTGAGLPLHELHLVGSHGQTVRHLPEPVSFAGDRVRATLQVGDPSTLAQHLDAVVVGNFRAADVALGGQGAPFAPYLDHVLFSDEDASRLLLNLGGIANVTLLPAGGALSDVLAFDTGPANMVIDALATHFYDAAYDEDGAKAAKGTPDHDLLADLLSDDYFTQPPPKSTGRERFGRAFAQQIIDAADARDLSPEDAMATATLLTAASVYQAYARFVRPETPVDAVIASGGGVHNPTLWTMLEEAFSPIPMQTVADHGLDVDAKEALCFAVLAHETINGVPTNLPSVTGASRRTLLGTVSVPG